MKAPSTSRFEISRSALIANLAYLRKIIGPKVKFSSVVKANAYGHGFQTYVPLAEQCGVRHFSVFSADEAWDVIKSRTQDSDIMIMGPLCDDQIAWAIENDIAFYVENMRQINSARRFAEQIGKIARVHLQVETGMHRMGLEAEQVEEAAALLVDREHFSVVGVCTHLAGAESVGNYMRILQQREIFGQRCSQLESLGISCACRHIASSAATLTYPETHMEMVRVGIAQYGYWPSPETRMHFMLNHSGIAAQPRDPLHRIIRWVSRVASIKFVAPGEFVGYGTSYLTMRKAKLALIPIGYYHGFNRNLSNTGYVLIKGRRAQVVGLVNMNMMMVDVTDIPDVASGDEVVLIGKQKRQEISVGAFSDLTRFLNYEVLVRLVSSIPRVVVD